MLDAKHFAKIAKEYTKKATKSKKIAQQTLIDLGIYTKKGKLTRHYR